MQKYIIKSFKVTENRSVRIYVKDERSGNYIARATNTLLANTKSLMDFMCLQNSDIYSVERQPLGSITRELFTVGDTLIHNTPIANNLAITAIAIVLGEVSISLSNNTITTTKTLDQCIKYVAPTITITEPTRRGPGSPKSITASTTNLDTELQVIQTTIENSFNGRQIRLSRTLRKRKETLEEFLFKFFTEWNIADSEDAKITKWEDTDEEQCLAGRRRSLGDLYMICKYYYPTINLKDVLNVLYVKLPARMNQGWKSCICSEIRKRVWFYSNGQSNNNNQAENNDEHSHTYSWFLNKAN